MASFGQLTRDIFHAINAYAILRNHSKLIKGSLYVIIVIESTIVSKTV